MSQILTLECLKELEKSEKNKGEYKHKTYTHPNGNIMRTIDFGIGFDLKPHGGFILDVRKEPHKFIGLIMMSPTGQGYTVCPFVKKSIEFSQAIPDNMRSPKKVQEWVITNAVAWKSREYTILNPIIGLLDRLPKFICTLQNSKFQILFVQYFIAIMLIGFQPFELSITLILAKGTGCLFAAWAIFNTIGYRKDPFR